jgi:MHS family proline/betaine transporter-like MFS transporter
MLSHLSEAYHQPKNHWDTAKKILTVAIGTMVEYYDYALYGFFSSILASLFFPIDTPSLALLKTFGIFLTGSLSKPFGAVIFGYIGDRFGRAIALKISMIGIIIPTMLMGSLPTYQQLGWISPCLLLLCRIFQGIFTSGASDGMRIFIYESIGHQRPCLAASLSGIACMLGISCASFAASMVTYFSAYPNAWRMPFLFGGILGILVFYTRHHIRETPNFKAYLTVSPTETSLSLLTVLSKHKRIFLSSILLCGAVGGLYHFYMIFLGHYLSHTLAIIDSHTLSSYITKGLFTYTISGLVAGVFADRFGPMRILRYSLTGLLIILPFNALMISHNQFNICAFLITTLLLSFFSTPGFVILLENLHIGVRYRCISIGHSLGSMLFSGSAPIISLWLWHITHHPIAPFIYCFLLIIMGFLAIFLLKYPRIKNHG